MSKENKPSVFSGLKNMLKTGSDKLKEKFTNIFNKDGQTPSSPSKVQFKENNDNKKPIFTIEEDEDHKVYNYHLEEDDEDYDYTDDADEIQEETKTGSKTPEKVVASSESKIKQEEEVLEDFDPYDVHSVCHRIYLRDSTIDLEGMNYAKCKRFKNKNKILSMIGVSIALRF
jgi:hypothetical protein